MLDEAHQQLHKQGVAKRRFFKLLYPEPAVAPGGPPVGWLRISHFSGMKIQLFNVGTTVE